MKKIIALLFVLFIYSQNVEANDLFVTNQLGAKLRELNDSERYYDFLERLSGCYVDSVIVDSKADMIGLKKGDIITKINGVVVDSHSEVANVLLKLKNGNFIKVDVLRNFVPRVFKWEFENIERSEL